MEKFGPTISMHPKCFRRLFQAEFVPIIKKIKAVPLLNFSKGSHSVIMSGITKMLKGESISKAADISSNPAVALAVAPLYLTISIWSGSTVASSKPANLSVQISHPIRYLSNYQALGEPAFLKSAASLGAQMVEECLEEMITEQVKGFVLKRLGASNGFAEFFAEYVSRDSLTSMRNALKVYKGMFSLAGSLTNIVMDLQASLTHTSTNQIDLIKYQQSMETVNSKFYLTNYAKSLAQLRAMGRSFGLERVFSCLNSAQYEYMLKTVASHMMPTVTGYLEDKGIHTDKLDLKHFHSWFMLKTGRKRLLLTALAANGGDRVRTMHDINFLRMAGIVDEYDNPICYLYLKLKTVYGDVYMDDHGFLWEDSAQTQPFYIDNIDALENGEIISETWIDPKNSPRKIRDKTIEKYLSSGVLESLKEKPVYLPLISLAFDEIDIKPKYSIDSPRSAMNEIKAQISEYYERMMEKWDYWKNLYSVRVSQSIYDKLKNTAFLQLRGSNSYRITSAENKYFDLISRNQDRKDFTNLISNNVIKYLNTHNIDWELPSQVKMYSQEEGTVYNPVYEKLGFGLVLSLSVYIKQEISNNPLLEQNKEQAIELAIKKLKEKIDNIALIGANSRFSIKNSGYFFDPVVSIPVEVVLDQDVYPLFEQCESMGFSEREVEIFTKYHNLLYFDDPQIENLMENPANFKITTQIDNDKLLEGEMISLALESIFTEGYRGILLHEGPRNRVKIDFKKLSALIKNPKLMKSREFESIFQKICLLIDKLERSGILMTKSQKIGFLSYFFGDTYRANTGNPAFKGMGFSEWLMAPALDEKSNFIQISKEFAGEIISIKPKSNLDALNYITSEWHHPAQNLADYIAKYFHHEEKMHIDRAPVGSLSYDWGQMLRNILQSSTAANTENRIKFLQKWHNFYEILANIFKDQRLSIHPDKILSPRSQSKVAKNVYNAVFQEITGEPELLGPDISFSTKDRLTMKQRFGMDAVNLYFAELFGLLAKDQLIFSQDAADSLDLFGTPAVRDSAILSKQNIEPLSRPTAIPPGFERVAMMFDQLWKKFSIYSPQAAEVWVSWRNKYSGYAPTIYRLCELDLNPLLMLETGSRKELLWPTAGNPEYLRQIRITSQLEKYTVALMWYLKIADYYRLQKHHLAPFFKNLHGPFDFLSLMPPSSQKLQMPGAGMLDFSGLINDFPIMLEILDGAESLTGRGNYANPNYGVASNTKIGIHFNVFGLPTTAVAIPTHIKWYRTHADVVGKSVPGLASPDFKRIFIAYAYVSLPEIQTAVEAKFQHLYTNLHGDPLRIALFLLAQDKIAMEKNYQPLKLRKFDWDKRDFYPAKERKLYSLSTLLGLRNPAAIAQLLDLYGFDLNAAGNPVYSAEKIRFWNTRDILHELIILGVNFDDLIGNPDFKKYAHAIRILTTPDWL